MQAITSAIQNANHPYVSPTVFMKKQRHGTSKISCRKAPPTMLITPLLSPEAKYPHKIVTAANTKEMEIILSAGTPSVSISGLGEKSCNNCFGRVPRKNVETIISGFDMFMSQRCRRLRFHIVR